jgi:preprotein translocase subunit SecF
MFGGEVIHDFSFALVVGILVATYSSVFVASPIVAILETRALEKQAEKA